MSFNINMTCSDAALGRVPLCIIGLSNDISNFFQPLSGNWADIVEAHEQGLTAEVSTATQCVVVVSLVFTK